MYLIAPNFYIKIPIDSSTNRKCTTAIVDRRVATKAAMSLHIFLPDEYVNVLLVIVYKNAHAILYMYSLETFSEAIENMKL